MTKKTLDNRYKPPFGKFGLETREIATRTSTSKVVYFSYRKQNFGVSSNVRGEFSEADNFGIVDKALDKRKAIAGTIEEAIDSINIGKSLRSVSANFSITLFPTQNWRRILRAGDWIIIYLYADGETKKFKNEKQDTKNIVLIGNIDRVARVKEKDEETDKTLLRYRINGRNFGKVFETTDLWFDPYTTQTKSLDVVTRTAGLPITGSPEVLVQKLMDIFLGPGGRTKLGNTKPLEQWVIPKDLARLFSSSQAKKRASVYDIISNQGIQTGLPGYKARQMIAPGQGGNLWEAMKRGSNQLINELYCEEIRDSSGFVKPTIVLKPRPYNTLYFNSQFGGDKHLKSYLKGAYKTLQDLAKENYVEINPAEVLYEDLGMDDHSRFNMFWLETRNTTNDSINTYAHVNKSGDGIGLPLIVRESIQRYGLRKFDGVLDFCYANNTGKTYNADTNIYKAFLVQLYDFYYANHLYEQGTIETTGVLEAELGKCLLLKSEDGGDPKIYYIEGYEHNFKYPATWTTKFTVTRGQFLSSWEKTFIDLDSDDWGQTDKSLELNYLIKSEEER